MFRNQRICLTFIWLWVICTMWILEVLPTFRCTYCLSMIYNGQNKASALKLSLGSDEPKYTHSDTSYSFPEDGDKMHIWIIGKKLYASTRLKDLRPESTLVMNRCDSLISAILIRNYATEQNVLHANARIFYLEGTWFYSLTGHGLSWLIYFLVFFSLSKQRSG